MAKNATGANLGFEDKLWAAADKLRGNMDASEYKHVVLGLIFLKYISDAFMEKFNSLQGDKHADPEDKDEYLADNIFWVPPEARWPYLQKNAKRPEIGTLVDDALTAIERDNKVLKGVLPKDYARPALDKARLGEIIDLIATIGLGDKQARERDVLGRVYEYFLGKFASAEGKLGGQFYTPQCVVKLLVEMLEPYKGRVLDPCCGSGGMFVLTDRVHRELTDDEVAEITGTYHAWRGEPNAGKYADRAGFCKVASLQDIESNRFALTPGRYVGSEEIEDDGTPFEEKMSELSAELYEQMSEGDELDQTIRQNLEVLGYGE